MIFKKLTLKNFMSYSNAEVDLGGIHVACLSGPNGAGKSSLLDAITWTLWEEGRARTDELIKLGQDEMSCEVEFFMEDELYRVYRSRAKGFKNSQGKSNLEFQIFNPKEKNWMSLTMSATRQTQEQIIKTLKMDYSTFVNSVYLRQGKADEFTIKRPNERKQILADILGLEVYDKLCDSARMKAKEIDQGMLLELGLISSLKEKVVKEEEIRQNMQTTEIKLQKEESELKEIKAFLAVKEKELNEKREKEKQIQSLEKSIQSQESLIKTLEDQLSSVRAKQEKSKELISNKSQIEKDYHDFIKLKEEFKIIELKKEEHAKLLQEKVNLEHKLKEEISETEQKLAIYRSKINDRENQKISLEGIVENEKVLNDFSIKSENKIKEFYALKELFSKYELEGQDLKHERELLEVNLKSISQKKIEINNKIKLLNVHDHSEPCPLCKGPIKDKEKVIEAYKVELEILKKEENLLVKDINTKDNELIKKRKDYQETKEKLNEFVKIALSGFHELEKIKNQKITFEIQESADPEKAISFLSSQIDLFWSELVKSKEQIALLDKEISSYNSEITSLESLIKSGALVKDVSTRLNEIVKKINSLSSAQETYESIKKKLNEDESIVLVYNSLQEASRELLNLTKELDNLTSKINLGNAEIDKVKNILLESKKEIVNINLLFKEVDEIKIKEQIKSQEVNKTTKELTVLEQMLKEIESGVLMIKEKEGKVQKFQSEKKYLEILEKAFGKSGIPVAIIETVVPEIEKEANRILNRLTDNQMHIALKTQREKKSTEGLKETLDVVIADNLGTRNYELYSGGEAFKIDFSLRLALSRLLANRAGAKLQTLIIDEGFGSQDNAGKERLLEVIRSIENEFELILVVTHLDELKESFPAQIQVIKDEEGSKIKLIT